MRWLLIALLACTAFAQENRDALRDALKERDREIERLKRLLADKDIEIDRLRRVISDIKMLLDANSDAGQPAQIAPTAPDVKGSAGATAPAVTSQPKEVPPSAGTASPELSTSGAAGPASTPAAGAGGVAKPSSSATDADLKQWIEDLGSKGDQTRERAIDRLLGLGDACIAPVEKLFPSGPLLGRRSAALLLGKLASPLGVPVLAKALDDTDVKVRLYAVSSLGNIASPTSSQALIESLDDSDPAVRMTAAVTLGERHGKDFDEDQAAWRAWAREQNWP